MRGDGEEVRRDVRDEVTFHIESAVRDLMAEGLDEATARREALRRFGSVDRVATRLQAMGARRARRRRVAGWLSDLRQDLRFSVHNLRRNPLFAVLMVAILALGVAVNAAVFRVVDGALLRPLPFPDGDRLVYVYAGDDEESVSRVSLPEYRDWVGAVDVLDAAFATYTTGATLLEPGADPEALQLAAVEGDLMGVLGMPPVLGRGITAEDVRRGERVIALDEATWRARFGARPDIVGETLDLSGDRYVVIGVVPTAARVLARSNAAQAWIPLVETEWMVRGTHFLRVLGRLRPGLTQASAQARAEGPEQALVEAGTTDHGMMLLGVRDQIVAQSRPALLALTGAVMFVLLIVCANLANLFYAHGLGRSREFAVRAAMGAGRGRLVRQVMTEGLVVGLTGGLVGLLLAGLLAGTVITAAGGAGALTPGDGFDPRVALFTLAVAVVSGIAIGGWPAVRAGRARLGDALRDGTRTAGDRRSWRRRRWLVAAEVALSVVLLAGAGLMVRSVMRLLDRDTGFRADGVLTFRVAPPPNRYDDAAVRQFYDALLADIRALPGVVDVGATTHLPLDGSDTNGSIGIVGRTFADDETPHAKKRVVTPGYFETMGIPLKQGRLPGPEDHPGAPDVVVISEALARRYWPDGDALGQQMRFAWGPPGDQEIVGIVGDILHDGLDVEPGGTVYRTQAHFTMAALAVVIRTAGDPMDLAGAVRSAVRRLDPTLPVVEVRTMRTVVAESIGDRRTLMRLLAGFAGLALLLASLGVYAVTDQAVQQRTREIGVRMAIGARAHDVLRMVVAGEMTAVSIGVVLGLAGSVAVTRVLEASLFGVAPRDPGTLTVAVGLIIAAAAVAAVLPAWRAARTDPSEALRGP